MNGHDFWADKNKAQALVRELQDMKAEAESGGPHAKYDKGDAIMTIFFWRRRRPMPRISRPCSTACTRDIPAVTVWIGRSFTRMRTITAAIGM